jgi:hypothetical protein
MQCNSCRVDFAPISSMHQCCGMNAHRHRKAVPLADCPLEGGVGFRQEALQELKGAGQAVGCHVVSHRAGIIRDSSQQSAEDATVSPQESVVMLLVAYAQGCPSPWDTTHGTERCMS